MTNKILWFVDSRFSDNQRAILEPMLTRCGIPPELTVFLNVSNTIQGLIQKKGTVKTILNTAKNSLIEKYLDNYINIFKPKLIVVNDPLILNFITNTNRNLKSALKICRGSVYTYKGVPAVVIDSILRTREFKYYTWIMINDLRKVSRWLNDRQKAEPKFRYTICGNRHELERAETVCGSALIMSTDTETYGNFITCNGYTALLPDGTMESFVIPFFDGRNNSGCYWNSSADEEFAWTIVRNINANSVPKVMQGGNYDQAYFMYYRAPLTNYIYDTIVMFHSIWCEAPKNLAMISSIFIDHYRFWKDEAKGTSEEKNKEKYPTTTEAIERYWRYNALDCHNTLLNCLYMLPILKQNKWAMDNYNTEMMLLAGPALEMSTTGMKIDKYRQKNLGVKLLAEHKKKLNDIRVMTDAPDFNPFSPQQVASLIYDVLGVTPIKARGKYGKGSTRSTDEKILKLIMTQHPLYEWYIEAIWAAKKPWNNYTKYSDPGWYEGKYKGMRDLNGRFMYAQKVFGTETGRFSGSAHAFRIGTNPLNVPNPIRPQFVADPGCVLAEFDYSQSDAWFVAYESNDPRMIDTMHNDKDTHCLHAAYFFQKPYEEIYAGYKNKEDWVVHSTKGVRQNTKRLVHGSNYLMEAYTMYVTLGHRETIASAEALNAVLRTVEIRSPNGVVVSKQTYLDIPGITKPPFLSKNTMTEVGIAIKPRDWERKYLIELCGILIERYHQMYPRLRPWNAEAVAECAANGSKASVAFGRTRVFFGDIVNDSGIQRELIAYYGQGGTAGNINRCLNTIWYGRERSEFDNVFRDTRFVTQTYDSMMFSIKAEQLHQVTKQILTIMEEPVTVKGKSFVVPADCKIGLSWGEKAMLSYKPDLTYDMIKDYDEMKVEPEFAI